MLDDDLSTTLETLSEKKVKKQKAKQVVDKKLNYLTLKPLEQSKSKKPCNFKIYKESNLPWKESITSQFKEYERNKHRGADQDVDTDDENIEYGRLSLLEDLQNQIFLFQANEQHAIQ